MTIAQLNPKVTPQLFLTLITVLCPVVLVLNIYPGVLEDLLLLGLCFFACFGPAIVIVAIVSLIVMAVKGQLRQIRIPWRRVGVVFVLVLVTGLLVKFNAPRRVGVSCLGWSFQALVSQAPTAKYVGVKLNRLVGLYYVNEYAADERGGVYFRTYSGRDGSGPDTLSSGFAYRPNLKGTPFGAARYKLHPLNAEWYWFQVSDDSY
jgi:hypothetical protein